MNSLFVKKEVVYGLASQKPLEFPPRVPATIGPTKEIIISGIKVANAEFRYSCPCCDTVICGTVEIELP